jgi:hypothetical protein
MDCEVLCYRCDQIEPSRAQPDLARRKPYINPSLSRASRCRVLADHVRKTLDTSMQKRLHESEGSKNFVHLVRGSSFDTVILRAVYNRIRQTDSMLVPIGFCLDSASLEFIGRDPRRENIASQCDGSCYRRGECGNICRIHNQQQPVNGINWNYS